MSYQTCPGCLFTQHQMLVYTLVRLSNLHQDVALRSLFLNPLDRLLVIGTGKTNNQRWNKAYLTRSSGDSNPAMPEVKSSKCSTLV